MLVFNYKGRILENMLMEYLNTPCDIEAPVLSMFFEVNMAIVVFISLLGPI